VRGEIQPRKPVWRVTKHYVRILINGLQKHRIWIGLLNLIYAMPSPNVLAQNDMQPVNFRLKGHAKKTALSRNIKGLHAHRRGHWQVRNTFLTGLNIQRRNGPFITRNGVCPWDRQGQVKSR